jgi:hypothetical protein
MSVNRDRKKTTLSTRESVVYFHKPHLQIKLTPSANAGTTALTEQTMRATFALLANTEIYNLVRHLSWQVHTALHTGTTHCRLERRLAMFVYDEPLGPIGDYLSYRIQPLAA